MKGVVYILARVRVTRARYFLAAVRAGSLRSAAVACGVTQPTIGQQLTLLEEELDVVLLTRTRRGVRPTAAGQALIEPMSRLVAAEDAVLEAANASSGAYQGRVMIGGVSVTVETIVAPVVGRLRADHPGLRFTVREGASADIEAAVLSGELDLAAVTSPSTPPPAGLLREHLLSFPIGIHVTAGHPLAMRAGVRWRDLESWPIVSMRPGTVLDGLLRTYVDSPDTVVEAMSARTVQVMVAHGAGVGVLTRVGPATGLDLPWVPITDAAPLQVCLVQRAEGPLSRPAVIVRHMLRARTEELAETG